MEEENKTEEVVIEGKEHDDGTYEVEAPEMEDEVEVVEAESNDETETPTEEAQTEDMDDAEEANEEVEESEPEVDSDTTEEVSEDREKIRAARREERRLKKELAKKREVTAKNKISSLEKQNADLAHRLASLESTSNSLQMSQLDKAVEDADARIEFAKVQMMEAAKNGDAEGQVEWMDAHADAKQKSAELKAYKTNYAKNASAPRQNIPDPTAAQTQRLAQSWSAKNAWFDPAGGDTDSRIAKVIDNEMANEGWDPSDTDYWDELDNRLSERLPQHYHKASDLKKAAAAKSKAVSKPKGPTASSRAQQTKGKTITLSRDRVQAIKDAGAWEDPARRARMIKAYAQYDKSNNT